MKLIPYKQGCMLWTADADSVDTRLSVGREIWIIIQYTPVFMLDER